MRLRDLLRFLFLYFSAASVVRGIHNNSSDILFFSCPASTYRRRYVEEVGELERRCDDLTTERNAMLVELEGLKRRKQIEIEVSARVCPGVIPESADYKNFPSLPRAGAISPTFIRIITEWFDSPF